MNVKGAQAAEAKAAEAMDKGVAILTELHRQGTSTHHVSYTRVLAHTH